MDSPDGLPDAGGDQTPILSTMQKTNPGVNGNVSYLIDDLSMEAG